MYLESSLFLNETIEVSISVNTKFAIGDDVFPINGRKEFNFSTCDICKGEGEIFLEGKSFTCPGCRGSKNKKEQVHCVWSVIENTIGGSAMPSKIKKIMVDVSEDCVEIIYKLWGDPIRHFPEKDCFVTKEGALEECRRRNEEGLTNKRK